MDEMVYNVLWIDDQHETLSGTKGRAKRNGINLIPFKSLNGGMAELERNYPWYDGVLLDAKIFENEDDSKGSEDTFNVHRAKERLLQLKKQFEVFILTGQAEAHEDKTFNKAFTRVYQKANDEDINRLFVDIKRAASTQEDTQFRHQFKSVFDVCTPQYLGTHVGVEILALLKVEDTSNMPGHFNALRKIVEDLFIAFNKHKLLPDEFVKPVVSLNPSHRFLAGLKQGENTDLRLSRYTHNQETQLPSTIASGLRNLLHVVQSGAHRSEVDAHVRKMNNLFLFKSMLFQLLDLVVWFKMHVDSGPKTNNWERVEVLENENVPTAELIPGKVINFNIQKGFAFFKPDSKGDNVFIPPHLVTNHSLKDGMQIQAETEQYTDSRTNQLQTKVKRVIL